MLDKILKLDESLFLYLNNLGVPGWDSFWLIFTEKYTHIPLIFIFVFLLYRILGLKRFGVAMLLIGLMVVGTDQLTNLAKYGFQRPRPCRVVELEGLMRYIATRCGRFGYFSGHSSNSMALAVYFGLHLRKKYNWLFPILVVWALAMGYSRIYVGVHYPLDLLTGFSVGLLTGYFYFKLYVFFASKIISEKES